jgi:hypothetical protein
MNDQFLAAPVFFSMPGCCRLFTTQHPMGCDIALWERYTAFLRRNVLRPVSMPEEDFDKPKGSPQDA